MILPIHAVIRSRIQQALTDAFGLSAGDQPSIVLETPPNRALGDVSVPVAFELARRLRKAPRAIVQELAAALGAVDGVARSVSRPAINRPSCSRPRPIARWATCRCRWRSSWRDW